MKLSNLHDAAVSKLTFVDKNGIILIIENSIGENYKLVFNGVNRMNFEPVDFNYELLKSGDGEIIKCKMDKHESHIELVVLWSWYTPLKRETIVLDFGFAQMEEIEIID